MRRVFAVQDGRGAMLLFDTEEHAEAACAAINADPDYYDTAEVEWRDLYEAGDEMPWLAVPEKEEEMSGLEERIAFAIGQAVTLDYASVGEHPTQLHDAAEAVLSLLSVEKVWWCEVGRAERRGGDAGCGTTRQSLAGQWRSWAGHEDCGWRWLVSAEGDE